MSTVEPSLAAPSAPSSISSNGLLLSAWLISCSNSSAFICRSCSERCSAGAMLNVRCSCSDIDWPISSSLLVVGERDAGSMPRTGDSPVPLMGGGVAIERYEEARTPPDVALTQRRPCEPALARLSEGSTGSRHGTAGLLLAMVDPNARPRARLYAGSASAGPRAAGAVDRAISTVRGNFYRRKLPAIRLGTSIAARSRLLGSFLPDLAPHHGGAFF